MSPRPARLSAGLLAPSKGGASPASVPLPPAEAGEPTSMGVQAPPTGPAASMISGGSTHGASEPRPPGVPTQAVANGTESPTVDLKLAENVRPPPPPVKRTPFSTRLSIELQEWLRTTAFVERRGVQDIVEEAIEFYRRRHRS